MIIVCTIGEFGVVYRGILNPSDFPQPVAAKTIRGRETALSVTMKYWSVYRLSQQQQRC